MLELYLDDCVDSSEVGRRTKTSYGWEKLRGGINFELLECELWPHPTPHVVCCTPSINVPKENIWLVAG